MYYTADFETTTDLNDCRVWAYAICEIGNTDNFIYGNNMDDFIAWCQLADNPTLYFHNLKFDGEFIIGWLLKNGFTHTTKRKGKPGEFSTLISDKGQFYSLKIFFADDLTTTILDSLKILPFSVDAIAKGWGLPIRKLSIDYRAKRKPGYILTAEEIDYIRNDVEIVARALKIIFDEGLKEMTQGSNALHDFKKTVGKKNFDRWFPAPEYDGDIRLSYRGGFTYVNPVFN